MSYSKKSTMIWDDLRSLINGNQSFLISSHLSLDGDSVGSQLAMYWYLTSLGKSVTLYNHDPLPSKFSFLRNSSVITILPPSKPVDILVVLDCSNPDRLGWDTKNIARESINIDHHRDNTHFGTVNVVKTGAAATGELLYEFFSSCAIAYPDYVAEALYAAIMTDTGGFRFSNTSSHILKICADLADHGAHCANIYERVYASHSPQALQLIARIWSTLHYYFDKRVCCMEMPLSLLEALDAKYSDSEGMVDQTITAEGVQVGMLLKHSATETHCSLRSKGTIDVGKLAQKIPGGGGHSSAAGCTVYQPYEKALPFMLDIIRQELG